MSNVIVEDVNVVSALPNSNTAGSVASSLVDQVIMASNPDNVNNVNLASHTHVQPQYTTAPVNNTQVVEEHVVVDKKALLEQAMVATGQVPNNNVVNQPNVTQSVMASQNIIDSFISTANNLNQDEMKDKFQELVSGIENMLSETYAKRIADLEAQKQKEIEAYRIELEKDKLSKMSENERRIYEAEMQRQAEQAKIRFMEQRIKELEQAQRDSENKEYITQQQSVHPYAKHYIERMNIKTKEEFKMKIEPILNDIKELEHLRMNNTKYGSVNALGNYNRKTDERKDITDSIKTNVSKFLDQVIAR